MTKSLEETFDLPPIKEALAEKEKLAESTELVLAEDEPTKILNALTVAEKIEHALTTVTELDNNDIEMDEIAQEALESYVELKDLAMNMADAHAGRMMEVSRLRLKLRKRKSIASLRLLICSLKRCEWIDYQARMIRRLLRAQNSTEMSYLSTYTSK